MNRSSCGSRVCARGGAARTFKKPKVKNDANQEAIDRLMEKYESIQSENMQRTLARAMKSLAASKQPITSFSQAKTLSNVGDFCARLICPSTQDDDHHIKPLLWQAKKPTKGRNATTTRTSIDVGPSAKEIKYQEKRQIAIDKWSHPISLSSHAQGLVWKILLLVDNREQKSQHMLSKCLMSGIPAEERVLPIGDMTWIAQGLRKRMFCGEIETVVETELLLGTILERKSTADLKESLFGTRYNEQRLRLKQCGQPQIVFLIEGDIQQDVSEHFNKDRLQMALMETRIQKGFQIVHSHHLDGTVKLLKRFHRRVLQRTFPEAFGINEDALPTFSSPNAQHHSRMSHRRRRRRPASLVEMVMDAPPTPALGEDRFMTYDELCCKIERDREAGTRTVGAIHAAMLRQVCGKKQSKAILESYPTPSVLLQAYDDVSCNPKRQSELLADCIESKEEGAGRRVGRKISAQFYVAYCKTPNSRNLSASVTGSSKRLSLERGSSEDSLRVDNDNNKRQKCSSQTNKKIAAKETSLSNHAYTKANPSQAHQLSSKAKNMSPSCLDVLFSDDDQGSSKGMPLHSLPFMGKENRNANDANMLNGFNPVASQKANALLNEGSSDEDDHTEALEVASRLRQPLHSNLGSASLRQMPEPSNRANHPGNGRTARDAIEID